MNKGCVGTALRLDLLFLLLGEAIELGCRAECAIAFGFVVLAHVSGNASPKIGFAGLSVPNRTEPPRAPHRTSLRSQRSQFMPLSRRAMLVGGTSVLTIEGRSGERMTHIALLGDSVIDNKAYVGGAPDVAEQLRALVPDDWKVSRLAVDGAVSSGVLGQLESLPNSATHLVISAGGNDALGESAILGGAARSVGEVLLKLADIQDRFRRNYTTLLNAAARRKLPTAVCSVYDPRFPDPARRRIGALALSVINDVITREAFARQFTLIDLRMMFDEDSDFANPIEPSAKGGMKLAEGIWRFAASQPQVVL